jgi:putative NADH-flavin reductase
MFPVLLAKPTAHYLHIGGTGGLAASKQAHLAYSNRIPRRWKEDLLNALEQERWKEDLAGKQSR